MVNAVRRPRWWSFWPSVTTRTTTAKDAYEPARGSKPDDDPALRGRRRRVGGHGRTDAWHGRRPGHRPGWARVVSRNLGDDDRRDDAAFGSAGGPLRRATRSPRADVALHRRVPRSLDRIRPRRLRRLPARDLIRHRLARVGRRLPVCRGRRDRRSRDLRADAVEAPQPPSLPHRAALRERPPEWSRSRPELRRLFRWPDGCAVRAGRDEPLLDGGHRRRDLRGEGPAARPAALACVGARP